MLTEVIKYLYTACSPHNTDNVFWSVEQLTSKRCFSGVSLKQLSLVQKYIFKWIKYSHHFVMTRVYVCSLLCCPQVAMKSMIYYQISIIHNAWKTSTYGLTCFWVTKLLWFKGQVPFFLQAVPLWQFVRSKNELNYLFILYIQCT